MARLIDPKAKVVQEKCDGNRTPASPQRASGDEHCLLEIFASGLTTPLRRETTTYNRRTIWMNPNSSLVSGFDSSTKKQVDFKRLRDKKMRCTIPCEDHSGSLYQYFLAAGLRRAAGRD
jgi:hypothetical protein